MANVILYRGVNASRVKGKIGIWWSTNPYYALHLSNSGANLFYVIIPPNELKRLIESGQVADVSLEAEYENYKFIKIDPENYQIKHASMDQVGALLLESKKQMPGSAIWLPGKEKIMYTPPNAIDIGRAIFGG